MGMGSGAPMGAAGQAVGQVGQTAQQPGMGGKGGVAPNAPTQLPPGVNFPMGGVPGNPGFPDPMTMPQQPGMGGIDPNLDPITGRFVDPARPGSVNVPFNTISPKQLTQSNMLQGLPPGMGGKGGIPGNPGFPDPRTMPQPQPGMGGKGNAILNMIRNNQTQGQPIGLGNKGGFPPRDIGYGGNPFSPNGPRGGVQQPVRPGVPPGQVGNTGGPKPTPGFVPRDIGYGGNPFSPNGPRGGVQQPVRPGVPPGQVGNTGGPKPRPMMGGLMGLLNGIK